MYGWMNGGWMDTPMLQQLIDERSHDWIPTCCGSPPLQFGASIHPTSICASCTFLGQVPMSFHKSSSSCRSHLGSNLGPRFGATQRHYKAKSGLVRIRELPAIIPNHLAEGTSSFKLHIAGFQDFSWLRGIWGWFYGGFHGLSWEVGGFWAYHHFFKSRSLKSRSP